jgi:hypothetical protein
VGEDAGNDDVLEYIGEVAGMKGVAIVHGRAGGWLWDRGRLARSSSYAASGGRDARGPGCVAHQPPRTGGMVSLSRRQVRRSISSQPRN